MRRTSGRTWRRAAAGASAAAMMIVLLASAGTAGIAPADATGQAVDPLTVTSLTTSPTYGQPVTLLAVMSPVPPGDPLPTGNVDFFDGTTELGQVPVTSDTMSRLELTVDDLAGGSHTITAAYEGDSFWGPSTSPPLSLVVAPAATSLRAAPVPFTSLLTGPAFSATLTWTSTGAGIAGRKVTFLVGGAAACTAPTDANGVASCTGSPLVSPFLAGSGRYHARFAGDADFLASSATGSVSGP